MPIQIRAETASDHAAVSRLTERAFGQAQEARLVEQLRRDGDAVISLVAQDDGAIAGHVLLSRMSAPFRALGLAPLSVDPAFQGMGTGSALVSAAIARARDEGWEAIFVLGDPAYYGRFGFEASEGFSSPYAGPYFMVLLLNGAPVSSGEVGHASAFAALD